MDSVEVSGLRIAYERAGDGPPLVLLHGAYGNDSRMWRGQLDALSDEFEVVAWDAPGAGRSSDPPDTFTLSDYASCLAAFIEALGLDRPHVLGLSFGSVLALELYRLYPDLPRSLVLASAYAGWAGSLPPEVVEQRLRKALLDSTRPPREVAREYVRGLLTENAPGALFEEVVGIVSEFHSAGWNGMARALAANDLRDVLPTIEVPVLLLYGDADVRSPLSVAEALRARIPGSRLAVIPGAGHLCNVETPDQFNAEVRAFLRSLPPSGAPAA